MFTWLKRVSNDTYTQKMLERRKTFLAMQERFNTLDSQLTQQEQEMNRILQKMQKDESDTIQE